jgi:hypothetical protein
VHKASKICDNVINFLIFRNRIYFIFNKILLHATGLVNGTFLSCITFAALTLSNQAAASSWCNEMIWRWRRYWFFDGFFWKRSKWSLNPDKSMCVRGCLLNNCCQVLSRKKAGIHLNHFFEQARLTMSQEFVWVDIRRWIAFFVLISDTLRKLLSKMKNEEDVDYLWGVWVFLFHPTSVNIDFLLRGKTIGLRLNSRSVVRSNGICRNGCVTPHSIRNPEGLREEQIKCS